MSFSQRTKIIALAIVHVFETSKPFGDYSAVAVLDDGAGISYGVNQFTHRSGSLAAVAENYLQRGGTVGAKTIQENLSHLKNKTPSSVLNLSKSRTVKDALRLAGKTAEMRDAQTYVMEQMYLNPAIKAAEGSNFELPLSLAVIYDSINHGSFAKIRDKVNLKREKFSTNKEFEIEWITEYVKNRDAWLESIPRLAKTDYRTDFFLSQIARDNWQLRLPMNVHGVNLTESILFPVTKQTDAPKPVAAKIERPAPEIILSSGGGNYAENTLPIGFDEQAGKLQNVLIPTAVVDVPQVTAEKNEPKPLKGISAYVAAAFAFITANGAAVWQYLQGADTKTVVQLFIAASFIGIVYVIARYIFANAEKRRDFELTKLREQRAHEIQTITLKSAQDPNSLTVRVVPQPLQNSESR